jgi:hypothetical protein
MFRKPPQWEPVKADPYQIERWVEIARKNLDEKLRFREVTMHMRHANERLDNKGNVTDMRHGTEKLDLARRKEENMRRLHDAVVKARTTGIIPDKSLAPTHTREEIAKWAREKQHELSEQCGIGLSQRAKFFAIEFPSTLKRSTSIDRRRVMALKVRTGQIIENSNEYPTVRRSKRLHRDP